MSTARGRGLRVLAVADHLGHPGGRVHGATTYYTTVYPRLSATGVELTVCFLGPYHPAVESFKTAGIEPIFLERRKWDPRALGDILRLIHDRDIEVLHLAAQKSHILGRVAGARSGLNSLVHLHDTVPPAAPLRWLHRALARRSDLAVAVSDPVRDFGIKMYGYDPDRVRTLHNAMDLSEPQPDPEASRRALLAEWRLPAESRLIGMIGRLAPMKGHEYAIRALPPVLAAEPDARLVIVGEGDEKHRLDSLAAEIGVQDAVLFTGHRSDVPRVLAALDVVAMPSTFGEGLPYVALEALAAGRAIVAFPTAGIPEAVPHEVAGLLVPSGDVEALGTAIARILADLELRRRLEAGARDHARAFGVEGHVRRLVDMYEELAHGTLPPRGVPLKGTD